MEDRYCKECNQKLAGRKDQNSARIIAEMRLITVKTKTVIHTSEELIRFYVRIVEY